MTKCPFCRSWVESGLHHCSKLQALLRMIHDDYFGEEPALFSELNDSRDEVDELERLWRLEAR